MSRAPKWDPDAGFHEPARGYIPAMPTAHDQSYRWQSVPAPRVEADRLQRSFKPNHLQRNRARPDFKSAASRKVTSPPLHLRQQQFQRPAGDPRRLDLLASPYQTPRVFPASNTDFSPGQFFPTYPAYPAYPARNLFDPSPEPSNFDRQVTPEVHSFQTPNPGKSIWSPISPWERPVNQIRSSPSVTAEPFAVKEGPRFTPLHQTALGVSEQQPVPSCRPNPNVFLSKPWTPPPRRLSDKAERRLLSPKNKKSSLNSRNPRTSIGRGPYSARTKRQWADNFERPPPRSPGVQEAEERPDSPYERPNPPTPVRGVQQYTKPRKSFGSLTRKASRAFTAFSTEKVRKFSDTVKHVLRRDKENHLDSSVFDEWDEDFLVAKEVRDTVSQAHSSKTTSSRYSTDSPEFLQSRLNHASFELSNLKAKDRPETPFPETERLLIHHSSASLEEKVRVNNLLEEHLANSEHTQAEQVPQPARSLLVASPRKSVRQSVESPKAVLLYHINSYKDYPAGQLPRGLPRKVGRREAYKNLFGSQPTDSIYLGGSDAGSDTTNRSQEGAFSGRFGNLERGPPKVSPRNIPRLRRQNAIVRDRKETQLKRENILSSSSERKTGRSESKGDFVVVERNRSCDENIASGQIENLTTGLKTVESAFKNNLYCSSDIEKSRFGPVVSTTSGVGPKRLTSKAFVAEKAVSDRHRTVIIPPVASRKVSDLRARFEQAAEQSATSFSKKTIPDLQFVKKISAPHSSGGFTALQGAGEEEPAVPLPEVLTQQITNLVSCKNDCNSPLSTLQSAATHISHLSRLTNELDQPTQAEATIWLEIEDENSFVPPPPIPRKSSKRPAKSLPGLNRQEQQRCFENSPEVVLPLQIGLVKSQPVTPENRTSLAHINTVGYYSDSVYSEDETRKPNLQTTPETVQHAQKYQTPPDKHPELLVPPLAIRKKDKDAQQDTPSPPAACTPLEDPFTTSDSFLGSCLAVAVHPTQMATLQVDAAIISSTKAKAVEDARVMQQAVIESCKKAGRDPPKYVLLELIGKGSFGRVYKGKDVGSGNIVAVKIIDIDESDTLNPRLADTYSEFMKEVNALKILSESKARNINLVIEALPVGKAMWMITEYCGGGSIATLMKPTPTGLKERFIIPILREVAEAVKWVHQAGIIHRDLKCANILITEDGGVQLCDFGVAGIVEGAVDKRSTFIGTFNWMAPELFQGSSYGKEVDIWAFGSMAYEMATGLPPNARSGVTGMDLGPYLKNHIPRLEGSTYSEGLKGIIAYCLEVNPSDRPTIEAVQKHSYIYNSNAKYPVSSLSELVRAFKMWESHGGTRKSLFMAGGAQASSEPFSTTLSDDNWNFSTTAAFDQAVAQDTSARDVINVYGPSVTLDTDLLEETSRPSRSQDLRTPRRRPPPEALAPLKGPLEKLFDPNTISTYEENSRSHYNQYQNNAPDVPSIDIQSIPSREISDLPLRDVTNQTSIRDTLIDLDAYDVPSGLSSFTGMDTIKPMRQAGHEGEGEYDAGGYRDFHRPALSDPLDNPNRRTQDWKFPVMAPPASAAPDMTRFPATYELQRPAITPASGARPALAHHSTEPVSLPTQSSNSLLPSAPDSPNRMSLIDLDLSLPEPSRPSTADSSVSQEMTSANPFHLEGHASLYHPSAREPSLYVPEDASARLRRRSSNTLQDLVDQSDLSASDVEGPHYDHYNGHAIQSYEDGVYVQREYDASAAGRFSDVASGDTQTHSSQPYTMAHFPDLPPPPSVPALSGSATHNEMIEEMHRMLGGLTAQLESFRDVYETQPRGQARRGAFSEEE